MELTLQELIDNGMAWRLEGHVGRQAADAIEAGFCVLGEVGYWDYYGNYVPSRHEVVPGTKGSLEYAEAQRAENPELFAELELGVCDICDAEVPLEELTFSSGYDNGAGDVSFCADCAVEG